MLPPLVPLQIPLDWDKIERRHKATDTGQAEVPACRAPGSYLILKIASQCPHIQVQVLEKVTRAADTLETKVNVSGECEGAGQPRRRECQGQQAVSCTPGLNPMRQPHSQCFTSVNRA